MSADILALPHRPAAQPPPLPGPLPDCGLRSRLVAGLFVSALLVAGIGGWAAMAQLSAAVIAAGNIVVDSSVKKVQHPYGGVVGKIFVRNGDRVADGDLLIRLDDTQTRAALGVIVSQITELTGRSARLAAEREGAEAIAFAAQFTSLGADATRVAEGEERLFMARRTTVEGQKAQLTERIDQLRREIEALSAQGNAKARELTLVREELARVRAMYKQQLTPVTRVLAMERDETRIDGEYGSLFGPDRARKGADQRDRAADHDARADAPFGGSEGAA